MEITSLALRCSSANITDTTYAAASIELAAALCIGIVVYVEHRRAIRASALLSSFLAIGLLIDITKSRSYVVRDLNLCAGVATATAIVRFALIGLEEVSKRHLLIDPELRKISNGEVTSGFFTRTLFLFLQPLLRTGFRGLVAMEDLGGLGVDFSSDYIFAKLSVNWQEKKAHAKHSLLFACCRTWRSPILAIVAPRLCVTGLKFAQPFLIYAILDAIEGDSEAKVQRRNGLIGATALTFIGSAICRAASAHMKNRLITRLRCGLLALLFDKSHRLKISEARRQAPITLMISDLDGIVTAVPACTEIPFIFLDAVLGMYFLFRFIGFSCMAILVPLSASTISGLLFGTYLTPAMKQWNENIETRLAKTSRTLAQLPAIRALGLGPKAAEFLQHLRVMEIDVSLRYRLLQSSFLGLAVTVDLMTAVVVIAVALFSSAFGDRISSQSLYPTLGIVVILAGPLGDLLKAYPLTMSMVGCFDRIDGFLKQEDHSDPRVVIHLAAREATKKKSATHCNESSEIFQRRSCLLIRFENVTIAPSGSRSPLLKLVNFAIEQGSINVMFGPTSAGKSTLLHSILGEAEVLDGTLFVGDMTFAFCGQLVFLRNVSVRDCIVGACEYEPIWFNLVVARCRLLQDLATLPNGEDYIVGSDGVKLSGGQRQRIAIARAVYSQAKVVLFDDIFSAIDGVTAIDILMGLCGPNGLLRNSGCTVVLSSHLLECLDVADHAILLPGNGEVIYKSCLTEKTLKSQALDLLDHNVIHQEKNSIDDEATGNTAQRVVAPADTRSTPCDDRQQSDNDRRRKGDITLYVLWIDAIGRAALCLWTIGVVLLGIAEVFTNIYVGIWIAVAPANKIYIIGYAVVALSAGLLCSLATFSIYAKLSPRASIELHKRLTTTVTQSTLGFLSTTDYGSILTRYGHDMELLAKKIPLGAFAVLYCGTTSAVQIGVILSGASYMTAVLPFILISLFFIQRYYLRTSRQLRLLEIEAQAPLITELRESATGVVYIRASNGETHSFSRSLQLVDAALKPFYFLLCSQVFLSLILDFLISAVAIILAIVIFYARATSQNATGLAFLTLINVGTSLNRLVCFWAMSEDSVGSLARLRDFFERTPLENRGSEAAVFPQKWPSKGEVQMRNISACHRLDKDQTAPVLHEICLSIEPGHKVGVMGRTGSGKSSLLSTLLGFLEYDGSIVIDGVDIKTVDLDELRSRIITISQDIVELEGTIRDNLNPYDKSWGVKKCTLDQRAKRDQEKQEHIMRDTLKRLQIWAQLETRGELEANLEDIGYSKGEMQLLSIARAVVRRRLTGSRLVLVDEATASVDSHRDEIVRGMIREYFKGCTVIMIAHRLDTIADADTFVHMAAGRISSVEKRRGD